MSCRLHVRLIGALALAVLLSACGGVNLDANGAGSGGAPIGTATAPSGNLLRVAAGDKIRVTVYGEDKLSGEYQIDTAGEVSLPLAGTISVAGLTKPEMEQAVTAKLKSEYLRNPKVTVDVVTFRPFYVLGEVNRPGEYPYRTGLNVMSAIAIAGGATYRANNSIVLIQRSGTNDMVEFPQSPTIPVFPGDVLRLQERFF
jgi:polysaccharide export outer membrane protein